MEDRYDSADHPGHGIWPLYVGLFLVLLSFFIMLVASSRTDMAKAPAVGEIPRVMPEAQSGRARPEDDRFAATATALGELGGDLAGLLRLARSEQAGRGEDLRVTLPVSELFAPSSAELREETTPFIDRIVAALGAPPPGSRLDLSFSLDRPKGEPRGNEFALAVRRDGAFARALVARGAPPAAIAIGIAPGESGLALLAFRYRAIRPAFSGRVP